MFGAVRVAIVIPALNEEGALPLVLADLNRVLPEAEIVVVDNGSTDRTADVAREGGAAVVFEGHKGYGSACLAGMRHLELHGAPDAMVILDADHADDPAVLPGFLERIARDEADLVLSSRTAGRAQEGSLNPIQRWGNLLQTRALNARWGLQLTDMGPMRAIRWTSLMALEMEDRTWGWNVEMASKAGRASLRIEEVPVVYRNRAAGESKISGNVVGAARASGKILWALWRYAR
jgi:glycosyltransferase involved in cell wall biosynthesis